MEPLNFRILNIDFRTLNIDPEPFQMQEIHFKLRGNRGNRGNRGKRGNNAEITNSLTGKKIKRTTLE